MNVYKAVNLFCLIVGIAVLIFALVIKLGMIATIAPAKSYVLFLLGAIIIIWALISAARAR